jgi:SPP1 gp7 family putative phage head morphogenesis protein
MNLQLRQALKKRAQLRRNRPRKKAFRPAKFSRGIDYERALIAFSREVSDLIRKAVFHLLDTELTEDNGIRMDAPVPTRLVKVIEGVKIEVAEVVERKARKLAIRGMTKTEQQNRAAMNDQYLRVIGISPFKETAPASLLQTAVQENVDLITSIPKRQLEQVEKVVREGIHAGTRVENIKEQIQERFNVSESRARLIARDQVGKLNAQLAEQRQRALGVSRYEWSSSNDERVRPMHKELDHSIQRWDSPPITNEDGDRNHPGEDYQCRCQALPIVDDVLDALGI